MRRAAPPHPRVGACALAEGSADSTLLPSLLRPGPSTLQASGVNDTSGGALVEVDELPSLRSRSHFVVRSSPAAFSVQDYRETLFLSLSHAVRPTHRRLRVRPRSPRAHPPSPPRESVHGHRLPLRRRRGRRSRPVAPDPRKVTAQPRPTRSGNFSISPIILPESRFRQRHSPPSSPPSPRTVAPTPDRTSGLLFI